MGRVSLPLKKQRRELSSWRRRKQETEGLSSRTRDIHIMYLSFSFVDFVFVPLDVKEALIFYQVLFLTWKKFLLGSLYSRLSKEEGCCLSDSSRSLFVFFFFYLTKAFFYQKNNNNNTTNTLINRYIIHENIKKYFFFFLIYLNILSTSKGTKDYAHETDSNLYHP